MPDYLSYNTINDLTNALLTAGVAVPGTRDELLTGIHLGYAAALPLRANALDQLRSDMVALHRAWEYASYLLFQGKPTAWRNIGVRIDRLIEHLQQQVPTLWATIAAVVV